MTYYLKVLSHAILVIITIGLISGIAWCGYFVVKVLIAGHELNKYEMHCKYGALTFEEDGRPVIAYECVYKDDSYTFIKGIFKNYSPLIIEK